MLHLPFAPSWSSLNVKLGDHTDWCPTRSLHDCIAPKYHTMTIEDNLKQYNHWYQYHGMIIIHSSPSQVTHSLTNMRFIIIVDTDRPQWGPEYPAFKLHNRSPLSFHRQQLQLPLSQIIVKQRDRWDHPYNNHNNVRNFFGCNLTSWHLNEVLIYFSF